MPPLQCHTLLQQRLQISLAFRTQRFQLARPAFFGGAPVFTNASFPAPPTAYTGDGAHQAQRDAQVFSERLDHLNAMEFGPEKTAEAKAASVELDSLTISTITKEVCALFFITGASGS